MTLIEKADALAARAHEGQMRKEAPTPYIEHPRAAAATLTKYGFDDTTVAAALVHDVLEDTSVTREELEHELGAEVLAIVEALSTDEDKSLPWEGRKQQYIDHVRAGSEAVRAVATAEKMHNLQSMIAGVQEQGPAFWEHFTRGKKEQLWFVESYLRMLRETWHHPIVEEYAALVEQLQSLAG